MTDDEILRRLAELERRQVETERRIDQRKAEQDRMRQRLAAVTTLPAGGYIGGTRP